MLRLRHIIYTTLRYSKGICITLSLARIAKPGSYIQFLPMKYTLVGAI